MKKIKFPLLLMAIAVSAAGTLAFTQPGKTATNFSTYHYDSDDNSLTEMKKVENWVATEPAEGCGQNGDIPCTISTNEALGTYLDTFTSQQALIDAASTRRD